MRLASGNQLKKGLVMASCVAVMLFSTSTMAEGWGDKSWGDDDKKGMSSMHKEHHGKSKSWDQTFSQDSEGHMTMRMRMVWNLDLNEAQRVKVRKIQRSLRAKVWEIEDKIEDISDTLFGMYKAEKRDAKKIGEVYSKIFDLRRQKIELMINAGNEVESVLTASQRKMMNKMRFDRRWGSWGN